MNDAPNAATVLDFQPARRKAPSEPVRLQTVARVSRADVALSRGTRLQTEAQAAMKRCEEQLTEALGVPVRLIARPAGQIGLPERQLPNRAVYLRLDLGAAGAPAVVALDGPLCGALLARAAGSPEGCRLPTSLSSVEEAALAWVALVCLDAVRGITALEEAAGPRLLDVSTSTVDARTTLSDGTPLVTVDVAVTLGETRGTARILVPARAMESLISRCPGPSAAVLDPAVAAAGVSARVFGEPIMLARREVAALGPRDVVLFPALSFSPEGFRGVVRLRTTTFTLSGECAPGTFALTAATPRPSPQELCMSNPDTMLSAEVEVELARVLVPIADLAALKPGGVLPLNISTSPEVTLHLGDRRVARAELVDIDGVLGARIIAMLGSRP